MAFAPHGAENITAQQDDIEAKGRRRQCEAETMEAGSGRQWEQGEGGSRCRVWRKWPCVGIHGDGHKFLC